MILSDKRGSVSRLVNTGDLLSTRDLSIVVGARRTEVSGVNPSRDHTLMGLRAVDGVALGTRRHTIVHRPRIDGRRRDAIRNCVTRERNLETVRIRGDARRDVDVAR